MPIDKRLSHWWKGLLALPTAPESFEYRRLRRVWADGTGACDWFANPNSEVHLTVTAFENFGLFEASRWLPEFLRTAGLGDFADSVRECRWSYEFDTGVSGRLPDVTIHFRDSIGEGLLIVEAKRDAPLGNKDLSPSTYLDLPCFASFQRRAMVYVTKAADLPKVRAAVSTGSFCVGFLSWEELAGLQLTLCATLPLDERLRAFVSGAINFQILSHGIQPTAPPLPYLANEPASADLPRSAAAGGQTTAERREPLWRLPPE